MNQHLTRRSVCAFVAGAVANSAFSDLARSRWLSPDQSTRWPPIDNRENFVEWMQGNRGEEPLFLTQRWNRCAALVANRDLPDERNVRAFLMTPREEFVLKRDLRRAYERSYLDIGFDVTISGPHLVGRMTSALDVRPDDKVLEVGTGSGYQAACLSNLSDHVWTIEIVDGLFKRTSSVLQTLVTRGYAEYERVTGKHGDGYNGWKEAAPFDKIIVTCGIDHVPPPLVQQLKPGGVMVIPVGAPGAQRVLRIAKMQARDGSTRIAQSDLFGGRTMRFVPFRRLEEHHSQPLS